jgi:hypothetical protein
MNADKKVRSQASGVRSQACRSGLALIPHLSSIIRNSNREDREVREKRALLWEASPDADTAEGREKNIHHRDHRGHGGKIFTTEAQRHREALREKMQGASTPRTRRKGMAMLEIFPPCFRPPVVCVVRGPRRKKKQINHR